MALDKTALWTVEQVKQQIDQLLEDFCVRNATQAANFDLAYQELWQATQKMALAGGKRLRPYFCLLAYQTFGGKQPANILEIGLAQELLHLSLLVHDDIIDRDYIRYSADNIAGQYRKKYGLTNLAKADVDHYADSAALLAGDLLLSGAHTVISQSKLSHQDKLVAQQLLQQSVFAVCGGELLDVETNLSNIETVDSLKIAELKTAVYSFIGPLSTGAQLAHTSPANVAAITNYGRNLGIAYQLTDDILGMFGDSAITGKPNNSDLAEGKVTYLLQGTYQLADTATKEYLISQIGKADLNTDDLQQVRSVMIDSGGLQQTEKMATQYAQKARQAIESLGISAEAQTALKDLTLKAVRRNK